MLINRDNVTSGPDRRRRLYTQCVCGGGEWQGPPRAWAGGGPDQPQPPLLQGPEREAGLDR